MDVQMSVPAQPEPGFVVTSWNDESFSAYIHRVREEILQLREKFPVWSIIRRSCILPGGGEIWYGYEPEGPHYVRLIGSPGTFAYDILRRKADLPLYNCDLEIVDDDVRQTEGKPFVDPDEDDVDPDVEDCTEEIAKLPFINVDSEKHFSKTPTYKQEIGYLLQCKGSTHIVQLLGRSSGGELVFPKFKKSFAMTVMFSNDRGRIQNIKRWMLEIIDGVAYLHSLGIVHRDLTMRNILDSGSSPLVICDLQCLNATSHCRPFELDDGDYSKFSFASDIFALGALLWECCFYNNPIDRHVMLHYPPPPPFRDIFVACTKERAEDRPTLAQLTAMYEAIVLEN